MSASKRQRLCLDGEQPGPSSSATTSSSLSSSSFAITSEIDRNSLLILDDECLYRIFGSLQLSGLWRLRILCKRLYDLTGRFYETEYANSQYFGVTIVKGKLLLSERRFGFNCKHFKLIKLDGIDNDDLHLVASHYETKRLKHIGFENMEIFAEKNEAHLKNILANVETIQFENCWFKNDVGVSFLRHCHNLKYLDLSNYDIKSSLINLSDAKHQWMAEKYPKLEFLSYDVSRPSNNMWPMISAFFEQNPNVEMFYPLCKSASLPIEEILRQMKSNDVRVKGFCLKMEQISFSEIDQMYGELNEMQEQNYFTELNLVMTRSAPLTVRSCALTLALLENIHGLYATFTMANFTTVIHYISKMTSLKSLLIFIEDQKHAIALSRQLINLEEIFIRCERINTLLPFVMRSTKLRTIYVFGTRSLISLNISIEAMNASRKRLSGACKVTIYVATEIYIDLKHSTANLNMNLVEIKMHDFPSLKNAVARFHIMNTL